MRNLIFMIVCAVLAVALAYSLSRGSVAAAHTDAQEARAGKKSERQTSTRGWRLDIKTRGGITGRGVGDLLVESAGRVRFISPFNEYHTRGNSRCEVVLDEAELEPLARAISAARPDAWKDASDDEDGPPCCDMIETRLTLSLNDTDDGDKRVYTAVWFSDGAQDLAPDLRDILMRARDVQGRARDACKSGL